MYFFIFFYFWSEEKTFLKIWDFLGFSGIPGNPGIFSKIPGWGSQDESSKSPGFPYPGIGIFFVGWDIPSQSHL